MDQRPYTAKLRRITSSQITSTDFDSAISLTGYGWFHYQIVAATALCLLSAGFQNGLSAFVLPAAQEELSLTSSEIGFINAAFLVGGTCSAFLWGVVADISGRKKALSITLFADFVTTLVCSITQNYVQLSICRFVNGFLIGAPGSLTFSYLAEFHAPKHRSKSINYSGIFFTGSWLLLPAIAWVVLSLQLSFKLCNTFTFGPWRIFLLVVSIPELLAGLWIMYLPESPKFMAAKGDTERALQILKRMFSVNMRKDSREFPVQILVSATKTVNGNSDQITCRGKIARNVGQICCQIRSLFKMPLYPLTALASAILFSNMFGYFGLGLWLPELLTRFRDFHFKYPNATVTISQLVYLANDDSLKESTSFFDTDIFESTLLIGATCITGNIISGWLSGKVKRKTIPLFVMIIGGVSAGSIYWLRTSLQNLVAACIFQSAMTTANMAIGSVIVDLFPTTVSAMAICAATCAGRCGAILSNILFGFLMDKYCEIPVFLVSAVLLCGSILCLKIPEPETETGKQLNIGQQIREISIISSSDTQA